MNRKAGVEVGYRYIGTGLTPFGAPSRNIWVVDSIRRAIDGLLYADLINEKDPGRKKTISTAALGDRSLYRPLPQLVQSCSNLAPPKARRPGFRADSTLSERS